MCFGVLYKLWYRTSTNKKFPHSFKNPKMSGTKIRQFNPYWYRVYPWLVLCLTTLKAFCHVCRFCNKRGLFLDKNVDGTFVKIGFDNWKKALERFKRHSKSNHHQEALMHVHRFHSQTPTVAQQLSSQFDLDQRLHRRMLKSFSILLKVLCAGRA